jgi:hypothetical protein
MNSRARFSLGLPTRLPPPSSQTSMAGSIAIDWAAPEVAGAEAARWLAFCAP